MRATSSPHDRGTLQLHSWDENGPLHCLSEYQTTRSTSTCHETLVSTRISLPSTNHRASLVHLFVFRLVRRRQPPQPSAHGRTSRSVNPLGQHSRRRTSLAWLRVLPRQFSQHLPSKLLLPLLL